MPYPQVSPRAGSGTHLNSKIRKGIRAGEASKFDVGDHVAHLYSLSEARKNRLQWKPGTEGGKSALSMQKEICATYNLTEADFSRLVRLVGIEDGTCAVRTFLSKRLDNPEYTLQEYIDSMPTLRGH